MIQSYILLQHSTQSLYQIFLSISALSTIYFNICFIKHSIEYKVEDLLFTFRQMVEELELNKI